MYDSAEGIEKQSGEQAIDSPRETRISNVFIPDATPVLETASGIDGVKEQDSDPSYSVIFGPNEAVDLPVGLDNLEALFEQMEPGTHTYQLAMSKDSSLCSHVLKILQDDLREFGYERYDRHREFVAIPWRFARSTIVETATAVGAPRSGNISTIVFSFGIVRLMNWNSRFG